MRDHRYERLPRRETTLKRDHPDERPPWWETTLMRDHHNERPTLWETTLKRDHPDERPPWWETTIMRDQRYERPPWRETTLKRDRHDERSSLWETTHEERPPWWETTLMRDHPMRDHADERPPDERPPWRIGIYIHIIIIFLAILIKTRRKRKEKREREKKKEPKEITPCWNSTKLIKDYRIKDPFDSRQPLVENTFFFFPFLLLLKNCPLLLPCRWTPEQRPYAPLSRPVTGWNVGSLVLQVPIHNQLTGSFLIGLMIAYIALFSALLSRLTALACGATWVTSFL